MVYGKIEPQLEATIDYDKEVWTMGLADTVTKAYMKDNFVFADAFNYLIYGGESVVDPKQLQELDTAEIALPFGS